MKVTCFALAGVLTCFFLASPSLSQELFPAALDRIEMHGWVDQGITFNADSPRDRSNFPVGYNDRSNEYQLNQLWVYLAKPVDLDGCGCDVGGRVDLAFGTDSRFLTADGLEDDWNGDRRFYHLALPQAYLEVAAGAASVKVGHFLSPFGFEQATAPDNFFYSHAISFFLRQPRTFTGALGTVRLTSQWSVHGGFHRGWDNWEDENDKLGFVGGVGWTSRDGRTTGTFLISAGEEGDTILQPAFPASVNVIELIFTHQVTGRLLYVIEHTNTRATTTGEFAEEIGLSFDSHAYGINQYLLYTINPCLSAGMRVEWLFDTLEASLFEWTVRDGVDLYALTWGLNWSPTCDLTVRPEIRWDWSDQPFYDDSSDHNQLLFAVDAVWTF